MPGLALATLSPFAIAVTTPWVNRRFRFVHTGWFLLILPAVLFGYFACFLPQVWRFETVTQQVSWMPSLGINWTLYLDGLSLLFALLITGIGFLVVLYSVYYLAKDEPLHYFYVYLLIFMGSMLGVVLSDNLLVMYVFWELTSISSFLLIGYWYHRKQSQYGAQKSMLITIAGGFAMLAGIVLTHSVTGTFSVRETLQQADAVLSSPYYGAILSLFLIGAFSKSAQFPFYIWLPDAMEAPTPVSAYLHSATMVKAGVYLMARLTPVLGDTKQWFWSVTGVGLFTMFWAAFIAIRQTDLKRILAFSTVSQLGLMIALLGYGTELAILAAVFHLLNHATFKGSLFMVAGIVDHETGTRDIRRLGGLYALMPVTAALAFIGTFAMAGVPPTNGFLSKEMFFQASVNMTEEVSWQLVFPIVAFLGSIFTFIYSMMLSFHVFTGQAQLEKLEKKPHEAPLGMLIPPVTLAVMIVAVGLCPGLVANSILAPVVEAIVPGSEPVVHISHWHGLNWPLFMTIGVLGIGFVMFRSLSRWQAVYRAFPPILSLNSFYDSWLDGSERVPRQVMNWHMTGSLRDYLVYMLTFIVLFVGYVFFEQNAFSLIPEKASPVSTYELLLALAMIAAALYIAVSGHRIRAILALGAVGFIVALFFVNFRAPDLALTQLVIETVTTVLFLLCFYHLPRLKRERKKRRTAVSHLIVSVAVGILVTALALSSFSSKLFEPISSYYVQNSYEEAGGYNVVNVILVDFRGTDTMLEILVLGIAGLAVYGLVKLRLTGGDVNENK